MYLPAATGAANQWALWDYIIKTAQATAGPDGLATVVFDQVGSGFLWMVDRVVVQSTSTAETTAFLYLDQVEDRYVLDGTRVGNFDVADNASALQVPAGTSLVCQWQGADPGAVCSIRAQITVLQAQA